MKKIIDGKTFDTNTAKHVCELPCTASRGDHSYHDTSLYRSPKGQFFVAGEGGPRSMWSRTVGQNSWSSGSGLRLVDEAAARQIMESADCDEGEFAAVSLRIAERV
jgi:hypothetical protein